MTDTATIEELALAADFPDVAAEQWRDLVQKVLKGADIDRRLVRTTADGIKVQPLYVAADAPADSGMPGSAPYVRGASAAGSVAGGWDIRQLETVQDPALANAAILEALEGGATSIQLRLQARPDAKMLDRVLADVLLDLAPVGLDAKAEFLAAAKALLQVAARRGVDAASFHADLNADPLGAMVGGAILDPASGLADAAGLAREVAAGWPGVVALLADGRPYHAGGASEGAGAGVRGRHRDRLSAGPGRRRPAGRRRRGPDRVRARDRRRFLPVAREVPRTPPALGAGAGGRRRQRRDAARCGFTPRRPSACSPGSIRT